MEVTPGLGGRGGFLGVSTLTSGVTVDAGVGIAWSAGLALDVLYCADVEERRRVEFEFRLSCNS